MKIGLIANSQGNLDSIRLAAKHLRRLGASAVFHLGVDYNDAEVLKNHGMPVLAVPGPEESAYRDHAVANRRVELVDQVRILLTNYTRRHENDLPDDLDPVDLCFSGQIDVVCNGAAKASIEQLGYVVFISPGTLVVEREDAPKPTFGLLEVKNSKVRGSIISLESGEVLRRKIYRIPRLIG
ncbi:MAG: hypothetical protein P9M14_09335 [Candidatus Alcyoniella australis]|nr:hypothetical protein [Candidatus Alcyoniella australis]